MDLKHAGGNILPSFNHLPDFWQVSIAEFRFNLVRAEQRACTRWFEIYDVSGRSDLLKRSA